MSRSIIEALRNDIEISKEWKSTSREVLNQITIMEALIVLLQEVKKLIEETKHGCKRERQTVTKQDIGLLEFGD